MHNDYDLSQAHWRKASYSGGDGGDCVEVATVEGVVPVRDSKRRGTGPVVVFRAAAWAPFVRAVGAGAL
ncbi:DUF397 domain-containing protein [Streptomyces bambusae]|nr:DUF397 domain-containing protein [Streptomyces bambusae]